MRKLYCTGKDLENHENAVRKYCSKTGSTSMKYPGGITAPVEFFIFMNKAPFGVAIIKSRKISSETFDDILLSKKKYDNAIEIAQRGGVFLLLLFDLIDGLFFVNIPPSLPHEGITVEKNSGRNTKKRDKQDVEDVVKIPVTILTKVKE